MSPKKTTKKKKRQTQDGSAPDGYGQESEATAVKIHEGDTTRIRVVSAGYRRAVVHWGNDIDGNRRRFVCLGGYRKRGLTPDVCPVCALIDVGEAGEGEDAWDYPRRFYLAVVEILKVKVKKKRKSDGKTKVVTELHYDDTIKLLGGSDGVGPQIFEQIDSYGGSDSWGDPRGYDFEIERKGSGMFDTKYIVRPVHKSECLAFPDLDELEDPESLMSGEGLDRFVQVSPIADMNAALGIGEEEGFEEEEEEGEETDEEEFEEEEWEAEEGEEEEEEEEKEGGEEEDLGELEEDDLESWEEDLEEGDEEEEEEEKPPPKKKKKATKKTTKKVTKKKTTKKKRPSPDEEEDEF